MPIEYKGDYSPFFFGEGHIVFRGNEGRKGGSVVTNRVQRGLQSFFLPGKGGTEDFWRVIRFPGGLKGGPIVANKGEYSLYLSPRKGGTEDFWRVIWFSGRLKGVSVVANRLQSWSSSYESENVRHFSLPKFCFYFI